MVRSLPPSGSRWITTLSVGFSVCIRLIFGGKLAVDERYRLRNRLCIAVVARPEHTEGRADNSRRTADDQNQRNERTGTAQKSDRRPCDSLSCADDGIS